MKNIFPIFSFLLYVKLVDIAYSVPLSDEEALNILASIRKELLDANRLKGMSNDPQWLPYFLPSKYSSSSHSEGKIHQHGEVLNLMSLLRMEEAALSSQKAKLQGEKLLHGRNDANFTQLGQRLFSCLSYTLQNFIDVIKLDFFNFGGHDITNKLNLLLRLKGVVLTLLDSKKIPPLEQLLSLFLSHLSSFISEDKVKVQTGPMDQQVNLLIRDILKLLRDNNVFPDEEFLICFIDTFINLTNPVFDEIPLDCILRFLQENEEIYNILKDFLKLFPKKLKRNYKLSMDKQKNITASFLTALLTLYNNAIPDSFPPLDIDKIILWATERKAKRAIDYELLRPLRPFFHLLVQSFSELLLSDSEVDMQCYIDIMQEFFNILLNKIIGS